MHNHVIARPLIVRNTLTPYVMRLQCVNTQCSVSIVLKAYIMVSIRIRCKDIFALHDTHRALYPNVHP